MALPMKAKLDHRNSNGSSGAAGTGRAGDSAACLPRLEDNGAALKELGESSAAAVAIEIDDVLVRRVLRIGERLTHIAEKPWLLAEQRAAAPTRKEDRVEQRRLLAGEQRELGARHLV